MRRPTSALASAVLGTALAATTVSAQQSPPLTSPGNGPGGAHAAPVNPGRGARHLLRNGWDYIKYQQYERALGFFREAESRRAELTEAERLNLTQGIERAERGLREAANGMTTEPAYARNGPSRRPGALALAAPPAAGATPAPGAEPRYERETVQLTSGAETVTPTAPAAAPAPAPAAAPAPAPTAAPAPVLAPPPIPPTPDIESVELPPLAADPAPAPAPAKEAEAPKVALRPAAPAAASDAAAPPAHATPVPELPPPPEDDDLPALPVKPSSAPAPARVQPAPPAAAPAPVVEQAAPPVAAPAPVVEEPAAAALPAAQPAPEPNPAEVESLPALPVGSGGGPAAMPAPAVEAPPAAPAEELPGAAPEAGPPASDAPGLSPEASASVPDSPPAPIAVPSTPAAAPARPRGRFGIDTLLPDQPTAPAASTLSPEQLRDVARVAQRQEDELKRNPGPGAGPAGSDSGTTPSGNPTSTRLEIQRAPSPTEARPIRAIPVPEEFVPLPKREWNPNRKFWAAAGTCHMPLYFQDAVLERYGYSMEQRVGPVGRYLSIPLDDPTQSKQRNQIAQPFFSAGLFAAQIALLPYNMIMDPPWEAEYDLGYYRPGDRVPADVYYLPLTGVGPPLAGKNYGNPPGRAAAPPPSRW